MPSPFFTLSFRKREQTCYVSEISRNLYMAFVFYPPNPYPLKFLATPLRVGGCSEYWPQFFLQTCYGNIIIYTIANSMFLSITGIFNSTLSTVTVSLF